MKTQKEFRNAVRIYRSKIRTIMIFFVIAPIIGMAVVGLESSKIPSNWMLWIVAILVSVCFMQIWFYRQAAKNCGLICPECSRVVFGRALNLATDKNHCPSCGKPLFS
jgi:hypothetical protein